MVVLGEDDENPITCDDENYYNYGLEYAEPLNTTDVDSNWQYHHTSTPTLQQDKENWE